MKSKFLTLCLLLVPCAAAAAQENVELSHYENILKRNIFAVLWRSSRKSEVDLVQDRKRLEEKFRQDEQKALEIERNQAEARALESKKAQLQNRYHLTGIMEDGNNLIALIQDNQQSQKTFMVKSGDKLDECKVFSIDKENGQVILDYENRFTFQVKTGNK